MSSRQNRRDMEVEVRRSHENRYGLQLEVWMINAWRNNESQELSLKRYVSINSHNELRRLTLPQLMWKPACRLAFHFILSSTIKTSVHNHHITDHCHRPPLTTTSMIWWRLEDVSRVEVVDQHLIELSYLRFLCIHDFLSSTIPS